MRLIIQRTTDPPSYTPPSNPTHPKEAGHIRVARILQIGAPKMDFGLLPGFPLRIQDQEKGVPTLKTTSHPYSVDGREIHAHNEMKARLKP